jgi:hypothetical protein
MGVTSWELGVLRVPLIMVPDKSVLDYPNNLAGRSKRVPTRRSVGQIASSSKVSVPHPPLHPSSSRAAAASRPMSRGEREEGKGHLNFSCEGLYCHICSLPWELNSYNWTGMMTDWWEFISLCWWRAITPFLALPATCSFAWLHWAVASTSLWYPLYHSWRWRKRQWDEIREEPVVRLGALHIGCEREKCCSLGGVGGVGCGGMGHTVSPKSAIGLGEGVALWWE